MPRKRMRFVHLAAVAGLGAFIAVGTLPGAPLAKGDGGGGGGPAAEHGNGGGGQGNGGGAQGNGKGGETAGGHGGQANGNAAASGTAASGSDLTHSGVTSVMLGKAVVALNATYAVPHPSAQATLGTRMQRMATYDRMMLEALQMPAETPDEVDARNQAIADARIQLGAATGRRLNQAAVTRIDTVLGLPPTDPTLGVP